MEGEKLREEEEKSILQAMRIVSHIKETPVFFIQLSHIIVTSRLATTTEVPTTAKVPPFRDNDDSITLLK